MYVFSECTSDGQYQNLLSLTDKEVVYISNEENDDGVYEFTYKPKGSTKRISSYFIEALKIDYL